MTPQPQVSISSTPALSSTCTQTTRQRLERQLAEHENRFKEPNSRIKKKLLAGQINQLKERLQELDKQDNAAAATEEEAISGSLRVGRNHPSSSLSVSEIPWSFLLQILLIKTSPCRYALVWKDHHHHPPNHPLYYLYRHL